MSPRVLHLSTYAANGGAARAASALDNALQSLGIDSRLVSAQGARFRLAREFDRGIWHLQRSPTATWRSPARFGSVTAAQINDSSADVVNLHWVTDGFLSIEEIGKITKPIVWSMYDMWPFCGTEHYGVDSTTARWRTGYTHGNRPEGESGWDIDRWAWARKSSQWAPMHMVPASRWLEDSVRASALMSEWSTPRIPHVCDTDSLAPMGRSEARRRMSLPETGRIILFLSSAGVTDQRKGFDLLEQGLNRVLKEHPDTRVVVAGPPPAGYTSATDMPITWHGHIQGNEQLRALYCSADVLAVPSREDNMPLTAMEAQSCGVPVVAFDIGGLPDIVIDGETGFLVRRGDSKAFADSLAQIIGEGARHATMGAQSRSHSIATWSPAVIARAYLQVYEQVLS